MPYLASPSRKYNLVTEPVKTRAVQAAPNVRDPSPHHPLRCLAEFRRHTAKAVFDHLQYLWKRLGGQKFSRAPVSRRMGLDALSCYRPQLIARDRYT